MAEGDVCQSDAVCHFRGHSHFLADAVNEVELHFGKQDGKGDTRKAAACAQVHDACACLEADDLGYSQGVEHVVFVQVLDVLAGYDVYL